MEGRGNVGVDVGSNPNVGVPQPLLDDLGMHGLLEHQARVRVAHAGRACGSDRLGPPNTDERLRMEATLTVEDRPARANSQITFLYYDDLRPIARFYEEVMGFELVHDQEMARVYRVSGAAFLGIVDGAMGYHRPQERNAVMVSLVVDDVEAWYDHLKREKVRLLSEVRQSTFLDHFLLEDPDGYVIEVQRFLDPQIQATFQA